MIGSGRYHEDFRPGDRVAHRRGHTIAAQDNQMLSLLTMNTAQTHYNEHSMDSYMDGAFSAPLVNACVALALSVGLTSEDMTENMVADLGYTTLRIHTPLFVGDTIYAESEVLETDEPAAREGAGVLRYRITSFRPDEEVVLTVERRVLVKRRSHWQARDERFAERAHAAAVKLLAETARRETSNESLTAEKGGA